MSDAVIFHQNELPVVIVSSSINFISYSFLPVIVGAASIAVPDELLTRANKNCFNVTFTASYTAWYLVVSSNSTKEAISSVIHYQYLWWKWKLEPYLWHQYFHLLPSHKNWNWHSPDFLWQKFLLLLCTWLQSGETDFRKIWFLSGHITSTTLSKYCLINSSSVNGFDFLQSDLLPHN